MVMPNPSSKVASACRSASVKPWVKRAPAESRVVAAWPWRFCGLTRGDRMDVVPLQAGFGPF
jgi:hypothetical protein